MIALAGLARAPSVERHGDAHERRTGVAKTPPEALFVMDDQQQIVQWSNAAAQVLGISEEAALGRPCYEVVRGRDPFGRAVCRPNCAPVNAL